MITCHTCKHQEMEGELFCSECGARLWVAPGDSQPTIAFDTSRLREVAAAAVANADDTVKRVDTGQILLTVPGFKDPLVLQGESEYTLGRDGPEKELPVVSLNPFGAREKGVSRRHASLRIDRRQLLLTDLSSSNGTWLNDTQLPAQSPTRLESGDEIRLGKLAFRIHFKF